MTFSMILRSSLFRRVGGYRTTSALRWNNEIRRSIASATLVCLKKRRAPPRTSKTKKTILHPSSARKQSPLDEKIAQAKVEMDDTIPVPTVATRPKPCLSEEDSNRLRLDLLKEAMALVPTLDAPAQKIIAQDMATLERNEEPTVYEKRNALQSAAMRTGDKDALEVARTLTNSHIRTGNFGPFKKAMAKLSAETREVMDKELELIMDDAPRGESHRIMASILEEAPRAWTESYLERERNRLFMTKVGHFCRGIGRSMLPTLPSECLLFDVVFDDDVNDQKEMETDTIDWEDLTKAQAIRIIAKHHNLGPSFFHSNLKVKPIMTSNVQIDDLVCFVGTDGMGVASLMRKRVTALGGDVVEYDGKRGTVPEGHFWAVGDNRDCSYDSRHYGAIPLENLRSKLLVCYEYDGETVTVPEGYFWTLGDNRE